MKINRFNENNNNFKLYFKTYKCDENGFQILQEDIKDLINSGFLLYDLYYKEGIDTTWNFIIYSYINDLENVFNNSHKFRFVTDFKDLRELRNWSFHSKFKKIAKEDIESIYLSTISNKFNI